MPRHDVKVHVVMVIVERLQLGNHILVHWQVIDGLVHVRNSVYSDNIQALPIELGQPDERRDHVQRPGGI